jgi:hypothetical protein
MRTRSALLPLAVAAGLVAAAPATAATHGSPRAQAAGGDAPPTVPSLIQTRITRTEKALDRLTQYVDDQNAASVVKVSKVIRRQTTAAWRGAKYYLRTAPPPVAEAGRYMPSKPVGARSLHGGAVGPVVADQYASAVAVFGLAHEVSAQAIMLTDGAHGNTLSALSRTMFWTLDKRDVMVQDAKSFEPPPAPAADARVHSRSLKGGAIVGAGFGGLMPQVTAGLDDEIQGVDGLRSDAVDLRPRGKTILRAAESQIVLTEHTINTIWPPVPAEG